AHVERLQRGRRRLAPRQDPLTGPQDLRRNRLFDRRGRLAGEGAEDTGGAVVAILRDGEVLPLLDRLRPIRKQEGEEHEESEKRSHVYGRLPRGAPKGIRRATGGRNPSWRPRRARPAPRPASFAIAVPRLSRPAPCAGSP